MAFTSDTKANVASVNPEIVRLALLENKDKYYTYSLNDQDKPFYIGKGKNERIFFHEKELAHPTGKSNRHKLSMLKNAISDGSLTYTIQEFFTDPKEALAREKESIALYGRENLTNLTDGGDGAINLSHEAIESMRSKLTGRPGPNKGKTLSEESKQKMSEAKKGRPAHNKGATMSDETRTKMAVAKLGKPAHNKGVPMSEETKAKMAESASKSHWSKTKAFSDRYPNTVYGIRSDVASAISTSNTMEVN